MDEYEIRAEKILAALRDQDGLLCAAEFDIYTEVLEAYPCDETVREMLVGKTWMMLREFVMNMEWELSAPQVWRHILRLTMHEPDRFLTVVQVERAAIVVRLYDALHINKNILEV